MIYVDIRSCNQSKYLLLLEYIYSICNIVSFHFPNFTNCDATNIKLNRDGSINNEYTAYLNKNADLLRLCLSSGASFKISNKYMGTKLGYNTKIVSVKLTDQLKKTIRNHHLFDWSFPDLPEDLCFYKDDVCRFSAVSHEEQFVIQNETKEDISFLKSCGFDYFIKRA